MLQIVASLTDDTRSVNYDHNMFIIQATDGSTSPKYKLLCFIRTKKISKEKNALAFNRDRGCHLVLCLLLIPFYCRVPPVLLCRLVLSIDIILQVDWLMACTTCLVSTVSDCCKNTIGRASTSSGHITKHEESTLLRYLWFCLWLLESYCQLKKALLLTLASCLPC
jgi:hypothetical protein